MMPETDHYRMNLLRARARRRGIDFAKDRRAVTDENHGGYRVWSIEDGRVLLGAKHDATAVQVIAMIEGELARLDALAGRYRKARNANVDAA